MDSLLAKARMRVTNSGFTSYLARLLPNSAKIRNLAILVIWDLGFRLGVGFNIPEAQIFFRIRTGGPVAKVDFGQQN